MPRTESEELRELIETLDGLVAHAGRVPLLGDATLDRRRVYDVLDRVRLVVPFAFRNVRLCRERRAEDGDPALWEMADVSLHQVLDDIDALDDLMHYARPLPFTATVRVRRERLRPLVDRLTTNLLGVVRELVAYEDIYGRELEGREESRD